ncbi:MAG TPA: SIMPL domain-containing protein [Actinomycetota bacterium]|nr:SIMPL domain-containing protein [Actinomycetota bacterium]
MNRRGALVAGVAVVALLVGFGARAMAGNGDPSSQKPVHTITVTSTATVKAAPDEAVVDLGVSTSSPDSARAFAQNAADMQAVLDALKAAGIQQKDLQTLNVSLDQRTVDKGKPGEHREFVATNRVQVTVHDLSAVGSIIDAAVQAGADSVGSIDFRLANPNTVRADALASAVRGARAKADALAAAADAQVVRVVTIQEQNFRTPMYSEALPAGFGAGAVRAVTPIVPPDTLQASVTVSVVWEIS